jgi:hypothetical protein
MASEVRAPKLELFTEPRSYTRDYRAPIRETTISMTFMSLSYQIFHYDI